MQAGGGRDRATGKRDCRVGARVAVVCKRGRDGALDRLAGETPRRSGAADGGGGRALASAATPWVVVSGQWSVVSSQWSVVRECRSHLGRLTNELAVLPDASSRQRSHCWRLTTGP